MKRILLAASAALISTAAAAEIRTPFSNPGGIVPGLQSNGQADGLTVAAPGIPQGASLNRWLTVPYFAASTTPYDVSAYGTVSVARAGMILQSNDGTPVTDAKGRYAAWIGYIGPGTGHPRVEASSYGLGVSNIKQNWNTTGVPGQTITLHLTNRAGYFRTTDDPCASGTRPDGTTCPGGANNLWAANKVIPDPDNPGKFLYGGYNPSADATVIEANAVQASPYGQQALLEAGIHYANGGRFDASGDVHSINVQIAPMRQKNPDGSTANPGVGMSVTASSGQLGYAYQAINTARAGTYGANTPGHWGGFLLYNRDDGVNAPYDAFRVDKDGSIYQRAATGSTPGKRLRVGSAGDWQVANAADTTILSLTDAGALSVGAGAAAKQVLLTPGAWTAYTPTLAFDNGSTAAGTTSARYELVGKTLRVSGSYSISAAGASPGGAIYVSLPAGAAVASVCPGVGNEYAATGKMLTVRGTGAATRLTLLNYDNSSPVVTGATGMFSAQCEIQ